MTPNEPLIWESNAIARNQIESLLSDYRNLGTKGVKTKKWVHALGILIKAGRQEHLKGDLPDWQLNIFIEAAELGAQQRRDSLQKIKPSFAGKKSGAKRKKNAQEEIKDLKNDYLVENPLPVRSADVKATVSHKAVAIWQCDRKGIAISDRTRFIKNLLARINRNSN